MNIHFDSEKSNEEQLLEHRIAMANFKAMDTVMRDLLIQELMGGNAGSVEIGGKRYSCRGANGYANATTGEILAFGNFQDIPQSIQERGIEFTLKEAVDFGMRGTPAFSKIVRFYGSEKFSPKGRATIEQAIEMYNEKYAPGI